MTKKRSSARGLTYFVAIFNLLAIIAVALYFHKPIIKYTLRAYRWYIHQNPKSRPSPSDFPNYKVHGFDVSHFQPIIDWKNTRALASNGDTIQFQFVFIKATEGSWWEDELFSEHWENAKENHIIRGAYHYFHVNRNPELQAENFIESVKIEPGDLPPVIDIEETKGLPKQEVVMAIKRFVKVIEEKYHVKPILYSNRYFIEDYLLDDFADYRFWIAHYYKDEMDANEIPWSFWQHTDKASLLSYGVKVDANVFRGNMNQLRALLIKEPKTEIRTQPEKPVKKR